MSDSSLEGNKGKVDSGHWRKLFLPSLPISVSFKAKEQALTTHRTKRQSSGREVSMMETVCSVCLPLLRCVLDVGRASFTRCFYSVTLVTWLMCNLYTKILIMYDCHNAITNYNKKILYQSAKQCILFRSSVLVCTLYFLLWLPESVGWYNSSIAECFDFC